MRVLDWSVLDIIRHQASKQTKPGIEDSFRRVDHVTACCAALHRDGFTGDQSNVNTFWSGCEILQYTVIDDAWLSISKWVDSDNEWNVYHYLMKTMICVLSGEKENIHFVIWYAYHLPMPLFQQWDASENYVCHICVNRTLIYLGRVNYLPWASFVWALGWGQFVAAQIPWNWAQIQAVRILGINISYSVLKKLPAGIYGNYSTNEGTTAENRVQ